MKQSKRFPEALLRTIERQGISLTDLARRVNSTYEHIRRLVRGLSYPSPPLLHSIARELGDSSEKLQQIMELDKIYDKYGRIPQFLMVKSTIPPSMRDGFQKLSARNKTIVVELVRILIKQQNGIGESVPKTTSFRTMRSPANNKLT